MKLFPSLCALLVLSGSATAQLVVPISQDRSVSGSGDLFGPETVSESDADQAVDFSPFVSNAAVTVDNGFALGSGGGIQDSQLLAASVVASGSAFANGESYDFDWDGSASGRSELIYEFTLTAKSSYQITGDIAAYDNGSSLVFLLQNSMFLSGESAAGPSEEIVLNLSGILDPGDYELVVRASGGAYGSGFYFDYAFAAYDVLFELTALSASYCVAAANSVGPGANLALSGSQSIAVNDFHLESSGGIPNGFGLFYYGPNQVQASFGDGFRCVGGMTHRLFPLVQNDGSGLASRHVDFTVGNPSMGSGQILPNSTWNFQHWYRDAMGPGGTGFNVSDGLSVTFCD